MVLLPLRISYANDATTKVIYVSSTSGNDDNSGLTPDSPLKTINKALSAFADTIKLKRGDVFYESISYGRSSLVSYGDGSLPIMSGYKRIIKPSWVKVGDSIWKLNLTEDNFTGYKVEGSSYLNNIGCIHEYDKDLIHGRRVEHFEQLNEDWDIWQCEGYIRGLPSSSFDEIYLYLSTNPNDKQLEFSVNVCGANMYEKHPHIDGIRFEGFNTAVNFNMAGDITNCRIDAMGGNLFLNDSYGFVCAGNGIQYWVGQYALDNSLVKGNYITRCYDCGITIQGDGNISPKNVTVIDNLIVNCCQGWEDFLHSEETCFNNCSFEDNIVVFSGISGWGYTDDRFKKCHIVQDNSHGLKGFVFKNNTFIGGNFYCSSPTKKNDYSSSKWYGNVCYIEKGNYLMGNYGGTKDVVTIPNDVIGRKYYTKEREKAIEIYRTKVNDMSTIFITVSTKKANRLGLRAINKYLRNHTFFHQ